AAGLRHPRYLSELWVAAEPVPVIAERARELPVVGNRNPAVRGGRKREQDLTREVVLKGVRRDGGVSMRMHAAMAIDAQPQRRRKPLAPVLPRRPRRRLAEGQQEKGNLRDRRFMPGLPEPQSIPGLVDGVEQEINDACRGVAGCRIENIRRA